MLPPNQRIDLPLYKAQEVKVVIKRLDLINSPAAGNKYFKLKRNLEKASEEKQGALLTFGGAYSNHIVATALAGRQEGFRTIGVIRGEELENIWSSNPSLRMAFEAGMQFKFVSRQQYRLKSDEKFLSDLKDEFGEFYCLPEGGTNELAVQGCEEILTSEDRNFHLVCCCVGTGGTMAGLVNSLGENQKALGFASLKADGLKEDICKFTSVNRWEISTEYVFGGYARVDKELVRFINDFKEITGIPLDPVYTGKMMYGLNDMIANGAFKAGTSILAIHSGGLQGIRGMNLVLKKKNLPLIDI